MNETFNKGQSLIEIAFTFPILILLFSGIITLGRAFTSHIAIQEAAQEGVLFGVVNASDSIGIIAKVRTSSSAPVDLSDTSDVTVSIDVDSGLYCAENMLTVTVDHNFGEMPNLIKIVAGVDNITLSASSTGMILYPPCP